MPPAVKCFHVELAESPSETAPAIWSRVTEGNCSFRNCSLEASRVAKPRFHAFLLYIINEVGRWRGTITGPAPSASSRTTQDRFRVMWLSSRDIP